jgi:hypothetical protein
MEEFSMKGKIIFRHKTAAEWVLSKYVPSAGEKILYDPDENYNYTRVKYGDGQHEASELPFAADPTVPEWARREEKPAEIYVGNDEEMPEGITVQFIMDAEDEE